MVGRVVEGGDLGTWVDNGIIVVLEGVLADIPPAEVVKSGLLGRHKETVWAPPTGWGWSRQAMKVINDKAYRLSIPIEVVTFLSQDVADTAAVWLDKYAVSISSCEYYEFDHFCESLTWRPNVHSIVDTDLERLHRYGQRGYQTSWNGEF
jgi:hypothetical protein